MVGSVSASWVRVILVTAAAGFILAACADDDPADNGDPGPDDRDDAEDSGELGDDPPDDAEAGIDRDATLRVSHATPPTQWDPHRGQSLTVEYSYHSPVYDSLLELTPDLEIGPMLATDWEWSDDGRTLQLDIREGVVFHDGERLDAEAVVTNLERARTLDGALTQQQLANVESVEATGEFTVEITLAQPDPSFLDVLAIDHAGRIVSPAALEDADALATEPVGSGQFRFVEMTEDRAIYERFDDYWDQELIARTPARLENIAMGDDEARYRALETGEHDMTLVLGWRPELDEITEQDGIVHRVLPGSDMHRQHAIMFNFDDPALSDARVRRALSLGIDRDAVASLLGEEQCIPTASPFSPEEFPGISAQLDEEYSYDPDRARELLEEAGAADLEVDLLAITVLPILNDVAVAVQAQLADIGIEAQIESITPAEHMSSWREGDFELTTTSITGHPNPHQIFTTWYHGTQAVGAAPEQLAELDRAANQHPIGSSERRDGYVEQVGGFLLEDPVVATICEWPVNVLAWDHVTGVDRQSATRLQTVPVARYLSVLER